MAPSPTVEIHAVGRDETVTTALIRLRREIYRADHRWIEPSHRATYSLLADANPFFMQQGNCFRRFVATRGGRTLGHVIAFVNTALQQTLGPEVGTLGMFECVDDYAIAERLLSAAAEWLRDNHGVKRIVGPIDFDIWHSYRFLVRGFDETPFFGEPYNKAWYPAFFTRWGFEISSRWCSLEVSDREAVGSVIARHVGKTERTDAAGYRLRRFDPTNESDVRQLHAAVMTSFAGLPAFTPCTHAEYAAQTAAYARVLQFDYVSLAIAPDGRIAAFSIAFPDIADAVRAMHGEDGVVARLRFRRRRAITRRLVYHSIGVVPAAGSGHGLGGALVHDTLTRALEHGIEAAVFALVGDSSAARYLVGPSIANAQRDYALFACPL